MNTANNPNTIAFKNKADDLMKIQTNLVAPKNLFNDFAKFSYRNCESILQAVKPFLEELGCTLTINDKMVAVGDRIYVKATATFTDHNGKKTKVSAFAREALERKGMDDSMLTGATSSYARKYALSGLFLLDDNQDADSVLNITEAESDAFSDMVEAGEGAKIFLMNVEDQDRYMALSKAAVPKAGKVAWKEKLRLAVMSAVDAAATCSAYLAEKIEADDSHAILEAVAELTKEEKKLVWRNLKAEQQDHIRDLLA